MRQVTGGKDKAIRPDRGVAGRHGRHSVVPQRTPLILSVVLAALLAAPTSNAGWGAYGSFEPDTSFDAGSLRMWTGADSTSNTPLRIYFDLFQTQASTTLAPNSAALGTRLHAQPLSQFHALLGVWKDCDRDGYIGNGATGLVEYRAELLPSGGPCARGWGGETTFNDGQWVVEFFAIGAADPCSFRDAEFRSAQCGGIRAFERDPVTINSNGTLVWLDIGVPGAPADAGCRIAPPPRSATASGGGILAYATCFDDEREIVIFNQIDRAVDPDDSLGLYFDDPHRPQDSDSLLDPHFPVNLFGDSRTGQPGLIERDTDQPAFTVFDCEPGTGYTPVSGLSVDPTDNRTVHPQVHDPTASWWDGAELVYESIAGDCTTSTDNPLNAFVYEDTISSARSSDPPAGEARSHADDALKFRTEGRGADLDLSTGLPTDDDVRVVTDEANRFVDTLVGERAPRDGGSPHARGQVQGPLWTSRLLWQRVQTTQPVYVTAYARLNHSDISAHNWRLPTALPATFGAEACGASAGNVGAADRNGWVCDPSRWYKADDGTDTMPYTAGGADHGRPLAARVGELYDLVDVDCYDGHLASAAGVDVQASAGPLVGALPCSR